MMRKAMDAFSLYVFLLGFAAFLPERAGAQEADVPVIVAFGDSLTKGYGLVPEDGFVPQLAGWLSEQGVPVRIINAGQSGDTTAGGLSRVAWTLTPDVDGMIVALGGNDVLRGIDPASSRDNLEGILGAAAEAEVPVLLIGLQAPGNYGPAYKAQFDAIFPELAEAFGTRYAPDFFAGFADSSGDLNAARVLMQPDGIHPNAKGVARIVEVLGPSVLRLVTDIQGD